VVAVARWSAAHRWTALLLWIAFVAATVVVGGAVGKQEIDDADNAIGASAPAEQALSRSDFGEPLTESVLVEPRDGATLDPAALEAVRSALVAAPSAAAVSEPVVAEDGSAALIRVELDLPTDTDEVSDAAVAASDEVAAAVAEARADVPDLGIEQVGDVTLMQAIDQIYADDLQRAELFSLPVTMVILVVAFGALIAAAVPVLLALSAVAAAMGLSALASYVFPTSEVAASVVLLVGMAVGVDYSLFYIRREREERRLGRGTADAIAIAAATSGRAVVVSGLTVVIAMAGMFIVGEATFSSLAVGTILVVAAAVIGSVTVLPALLAILGRWVDRPRVPLLWRLQSRDGDPRFWRAVLRPVLARPAVAFAVGAGLLLALAAPALGMRLGDSGIDDLPKDSSTLQAYDRVLTAFPAEGNAHQVVVWSANGEPLDQAEVDAAAADLERAAADAGAFAVGTEPLTPTYSRAGDVATIAVPTPEDYNRPSSADSLVVLREDIVPATLGGLSGVESGVTGGTALTQDFRELLRDRMPFVIGAVLLLTLVVLVLSFRSLTIALTAIGLNLLSVAAAYGLVTMVFQGSWAEGLLGFESNGQIITWLPLFLFVILFGLSMDYHVFVVSRIREARDGGLSTRSAVARGITSSAGTVTSAAVVMVAVFSIFATLSALDFKQLGVGLAAAILIDATIVRAVLLPSAMALLGERNWWLPRPLQRLPVLH
jgi:RND superfamily putative drug exporter